MAGAWTISGTLGGDVGSWFPWMWSVSPQVHKVSYEVLWKWHIWEAWRSRVTAKFRLQDPPKAGGDKKNKSGYPSKVLKDQRAARRD